MHYAPVSRHRKPIDPVPSVEAVPQPLAGSASCNLIRGGNRLDLPPNDDRYLKLPDSFGRRFMVFCDTEEEFDWSRPLSRDNRSTTHMKALPAAHRRLADMGAHSIYLIDHPIATDPASVEILGPLWESGDCGIGTQLHPWVNPPFEEEVSCTNSYAGNLPEPLERAKLRNLTETIERSFGRRPIVYRAGRYGVGPNTATILEDLGYRIDVSVRARFDYSHETGPDFSTIKPVPYRIGNGPLLEVPLSSAYQGLLRPLGPTLFPLSGKMLAMRGALVRAGLLNRAPLTPEGCPLSEALPAVDQLLDEGHQLISISYHSPSIEPGHTPFVRSQAELDRFYAWWEAVLGLLDKRGIKAATIEDVVQASEAAVPIGG